MRIIRLKVPEKSTARGTSLVQDLATTDLCLGIDGSPTFFRPPAALSPIAWGTNNTKKKRKVFEETTENRYWTIFSVARDFVF